MKKDIFSSTALLSILSLCLLFTEGCKLKNPLEGVVISIKADAVTAPSELLIRDAKTGSPLASLTSATPVTITGPGVPYVYSSGASKSISIFQGAVAFSLRKGTPVSNNNPINFTVLIDVPGYLPLEYPITLYSLDPTRFEAYLVSIENPPAGAASSSKTIITGSDGKTSDTSTIVIPATAGKTEALKIAIDAATQMFDGTGQPVSGNIEAKVMQFTAGKKESLQSFPGGLTFSELKDVNGNKIAGGGFEPSGWMDLSMSAGGKSIKTFNKPLATTMEINKDQINPKTNQKFKAGDELDIYSKTAGEDNWVKEGTATISTNSASGNLEATMQVKHLSVWAMGVFTPLCGTQLKISVKLPNNFDRVYTITIYKVIGGFYLEPVYINFSKSDATNSDGFIIKETGITPISTMDYVIGDEKGTRYSGKLCGIEPNLPGPADEPPSTIMENTVEIKCTNGSQVFLPNNYFVYFIDEEKYQASSNQAAGGRKVDPRDPPIADGSGNFWDWNQSQIRLEENNGTFLNKLSIPKADLLPNKKYRFSVYYNDGTKESREDYITPVPLTQEVLNSGSQIVPITLSKCPL